MKKSQDKPTWAGPEQQWHKMESAGTKAINL